MALTDVRPAVVRGVSEGKQNRLSMQVKINTEFDIWFRRLTTRIARILEQGLWTQALSISNKPYTGLDSRQQDLNVSNRSRVLSNLFISPRSIYPLLHSIFRKK